MPKATIRMSDALYEKINFHEREAGETFSDAARRLLHQSTSADKGNFEDLENAVMELSQRVVYLAEMIERLENRTQKKDSLPVSFEENDQPNFSSINVGA